MKHALASCCCFVVVVNKSSLSYMATGQFFKGGMGGVGWVVGGFACAQFFSKKNKKNYYHYFKIIS
jgi:prolipoprotein diacylglyceryltransferase